MKPRFSIILEKAIQEGVSRGWDIAHKRIENPEPNEIIEHINRSVLYAIHEYFTLDKEDS